MVGSLRADDNVRRVETKLRDQGFYFDEIDGAYSSALAAALTRYQIRNGLPITGQLDEETGKALGAKPAVTNDAADPAKSAETWRRLRKKDEQFLAKSNARGATSRGAAASTATAQAGSTSMPHTSVAPTLRAPAESPSEQVASQTTAASASLGDASLERIRDYVAAFILAGLDPQVGAETDFFADRAQYYNDGVLDREKIRKDLQRYDARWPQRRFWLAGDIRILPQNDGRLEVSFPLRFELGNGRKHSAGKIDKTIMLKPSGEDWQIVAVNERKAE